MSTLDDLDMEIPVSNIDEGKLQKLLAQDLPQVAVANAMGCTEGFISQRMADAGFRAQVAALRIARLESAGDRDSALDKLEDTLISKLEAAVPLMYKPRDILDAFKTINAAKRSNSLMPTTPGEAFGQQARIVLPRVMAVTFIQNNFGEIVEAGGRSLATLPTNALKQLAATQTQSLNEVSNGNNTVRNAPPPRGIEDASVIKAAPLRATATATA